jgi:micrococcal nuclease
MMARVIAAVAIAWQAAVISADSAAKHVGETATVEGTVANVKHAPRFHAIFVDFGAAYPNQSFTALINEKDAPKFPDVDKLMSHKARVTGKIVLYKGRPEIVVTEASQLTGE